MSDEKTLTLGELPDFPKFADDHKTPAFQTAQSGYGALRKLLADHRRELERIDGNLELPAANKARLKNRAAKKGGERLDEIRKDYIRSVKSGAIAAEVTLHSGATVSSRIPAHEQREVRNWLLGLGHSERMKAITDAMTRGDETVLVSALSGPKAFRLIPDDRRVHVARQLDPQQAELADVLADAVAHLNAGESIVAHELDKARDVEAARADELAAAEKAAIAARAG